MCVAVCVCRKKGKDLKKIFLKFWGKIVEGIIIKIHNQSAEYSYFVDWHSDRCLISINHYKLILKEPSRGVLKKGCSENLQ